jgi:putative flavoprotein involved in K+ transport
LLPDGVLLADGSRLEVDAVIAATGYRNGLHSLVGHLGVLDERQLPAPRGRGRATRPGLYFVGYSNSIAGLLFTIQKEAASVCRSERRQTLPLPRATTRET